MLLGYTDGVLLTRHCHSTTPCLLEFRDMGLLSQGSVSDCELVSFAEKQEQDNPEKG